MRYEI